MPASEAPFEIDLDQEKVFFDSRWLSRTELAEMLAQRLASMDYNIARLSAAVEQLDRAVQAAESFSVRLSPEVAAQLRDTAARQSMPVGAVVREAVVSYLVGAALSKLG
ncbi:MAG: hypothetical protein JXR96_07880 [Deltaproteobacteria bacterium]|nr:hypothetical protein [Deltaproteobacteria bacterium]